MDVESGLPLVNFFRLDSLFASHCPNRVKDLDSLWNLTSLPNYPMIVVAMVIHLTLHGLAKLLGVWSLHGLVVVEGVGIGLGQESDWIVHLIRYLRLKIGGQHLICHRESQAFLLCALPCLNRWNPGLA
jgi:hypothetical protein